MRLLSLLFLVLASQATAQITLKKPAAPLPLPISLWEYYTSDSTAFIYSSLGRLQQYAYCHADENTGAVPGFNDAQSALVALSGLIGGHEGSAVYSLTEETDLAKRVTQLRALNLSKIPKIFEDYGAFARKNATAIQEGDSAIMVRTWYYDSLLYDASTTGADFVTLYSTLRSPNLWVRNDGQRVDPNAKGTITIKNLKGRKLEEVSQNEEGYFNPTYSSTPNGVLLTETIQAGGNTITKYYYPNGNLVTLDSANTAGNASTSRTYFPNGKLNTEYSSKYTFDEEGNITGGGTIEKSYYSNGKLACEIHTDTEGTAKIVTANGRNGKPSASKGSGKVWRESIDIDSGMSTYNMNEYKNNVMDGLNEVYIGDVLTSTWSISNGILTGSQKQFHWKNGKIINESNYDAQGNYINDASSFDKNAPKIEPKRLKVKVTVEPDQSCSQYGVYDPKYTRAVLKNEAALIKALTTRYNLLHYNTTDLMPAEAFTYKYIVVDVSEAGKPINTLGYEDNDGEITRLLEFNPAGYNGKAVKSRVMVQIVTVW